MAQGFGKSDIMHIAHRTIKDRRSNFMNFAKDASQVLAGKRIPERANDDISKDEGR